MKKIIFALGLVLVITGLLTLFWPDLFLSARHVALASALELAAAPLALVIIGAVLSVIAAKFLKP